MGKIRKVHSDFRATLNPAVKRAITIEQRKSDTGCHCHGLDLVRCPNYQPVIWESYRRRAITPRWL